MLVGMAADLFYPAKDVFLGFFAEALDRAELMLGGCFSELFDRFDSQFFIKNLDPLGPEARNPKHFKKTGGKGGLEFLVVGELTGFNELDNFFSNPGANPLQLFELIGGDQFLEIFRGGGYDAGGVMVGPRFEWIFTVELLKSADFIQDRCNFFIRHAAQEKSTQIRGEIQTCATFDAGSYHQRRSA